MSSTCLSTGTTALPATTTRGPSSWQGRWTRCWPSLAGRASATVSAKPGKSWPPSWPPSSRGVLSPSPFAHPHDFVDIRRWTYLDCSTLQLHSRTLGNELNCVIQISRFKHLNSTQLLLRFRVRTVCHRNLSVLPRHGHRRVGGLKRFLSDQMSVLPQFVVVAKTLVQHGVALALRHVFELAGLEVSQTDIFHQFLLVSRDSESHSSSFCYQIVVRETENRQLLHFSSLVRGRPIHGTRLGRSRAPRR